MNCVEFFELKQSSSTYGSRRFRKAFGGCPNLHRSLMPKSSLFLAAIISLYFTNYQVTVLIVPTVLKQVIVKALHLSLCSSLCAN